MILTRKKDGKKSGISNDRISLSSGMKSILISSHVTSEEDIKTQHVNIR